MRREVLSQFSDAACGRDVLQVRAMPGRARGGLGFAGACSMSSDHVSQTYRRGQASAARSMLKPNQLEDGGGGVSTFV